jgi:hypothetical protein
MYTAAAVHESTGDWMKRSRPSKISKPTGDLYPWDAPAVAAAVQDILDSLEITAIDAQARRALQRILYRKQQFGQDGGGDLILLLRTIVESEPNGTAALIEPVVHAVSICMEPQWTSAGLRWLEAFDGLPLLQILETMRGLDVFAETSLGNYLAMALRNKLAKIEASKPLTVVERNIEHGLELLELHRTTPRSRDFVREVSKRGVKRGQACSLMQVARAYGTRPEIFRRVSWVLLRTLAWAVAAGSGSAAHRVAHHRWRARGGARDPQSQGSIEDWQTGRETGAEDGRVRDHVV